MIVKLFLLSHHDGHVDGKGVQMALHLVAQSLDSLQPRGIFLSGDDQLRRGEGTEAFVDTTDVLFPESVMVAECHGRDVGRDRRQVLYHLLR